MEVPRLGVEEGLQLPAYTTATAVPDLSQDMDLPHHSWRCQILNPLSKARDRTHVLMDTGQISFPLSHNRNSLFILLKNLPKGVPVVAQWLANPTEP